MGFRNGRTIVARLGFGGRGLILLRVDFQLPAWSHCHFRMVLGALRQFLRRWNNCGRGAALGDRLGLPGGLGRVHRFQAVENVLKGGLRLLRGFGRSFSGAHRGARLVGEHFVVAGDVGVTRGHPRGGLGSPAATRVPDFSRRGGFACRGRLALQVGRYAAIDFLLPLGKKNRCLK